MIDLKAEKVIDAQLVQVKTAKNSFVFVFFVFKKEFILVLLYLLCVELIFFLLCWQLKGVEIKAVHFLSPA